VSTGPPSMSPLNVRAEQTLLPWWRFIRLSMQQNAFASPQTHGLTVATIASRPRGSQSPP
jgi:hypothetical protein